MSFNKLPLLKQILEQYFLSLNGKRAMTGNLDMVLNRVLYSNISLKEHGEGSLRIRNRDDTDDRHLICNILDLGRITCTQYNYLSLFTRADPNSKFEIYSYVDGIGYVLMAGSYGSVFGGCFKIPRAGDITGLAGNTIDFPAYKVGGVAGVDGSFVSADGKIVSVTKGLITSIVNL